ncbi:MAG: sulfate permease [Kiritimatiellales bacterium]
MHTRLIPQMFTCFRGGYSLKTFSSDLIAGMITGIVALPLSIAFAIASGVNPEQGLYTAIIAGFLISFFSGSRVQIGGPTGAFIVIVYGIVQQYGVQGLAVATLMAGVMLVLMGICRLGSIIKYLPYPLIIGFTTGIAVIIATTQIPDFLGMQLTEFPGEYIGKLAAIGTNLNLISPYSAGIGIISIGIMILWPRVGTKKIPGSLIALIAATLIVMIFQLPVETIGSRFGSVPSHLPSFTLPAMDFQIMRGLFAPALTIALLAAIESLLSAVVADGMTGKKHRSNMELVAQGIANIASPLFGGIPATGAIARTATNIKNGGATPVAGIIHAITLTLILLFFGRYAALVPMPALAAVLLIVAYNMSEWRFFIKLFKSPRSDVLVLLTVFLLTVFADLSVAIQVGVVLAAFLFMRRMEIVTQAGFLDPANDDDTGDPNALQNFTVPDGVEVFEINGPFFFGAASKFQDGLSTIASPKILILRMRNVPAIDATGLRALEEVVDSTRKHGTIVLISGIHKQPAAAMKKAGLVDKIGHDRIHKNIGRTLEHANALLK